METDYAGIDYGLGKSNIDSETGIRYGVISMHVVDFWSEESESYDRRPTCPTCFNEVDDATDFQDDEIEDDYFCTVCNKGVDGNNPDIWPDMPISWFVDNDEISAEQQADDTDIFVLKSLYFTYAQFCSPCAPGAVHLENPLDFPIDNNKGYCFGHDWFEGGIAPYSVYSVASGEVVNPS